MRQSQFRDHRIFGILKQAEPGTAVGKFLLHAAGFPTERRAVFRLRASVPGARLAACGRQVLASADGDRAKPAGCQVLASAREPTPGGAYPLGCGLAVRRCGVVMFRHRRSILADSI